jgi:hypothetical protein
LNLKTLEWLFTPRSLQKSMNQSAGIRPGDQKGAKIDAAKRRIVLTSR